MKAFNGFLLKFFNIISIIVQTIQKENCFGNGYRYWFDKGHGVACLNEVYEKRFDPQPARDYIEKRTWDIPAKQMDNALKELFK